MHYSPGPMALAMLSDRLKICTLFFSWVMLVLFVLCLFIGNFILIFKAFGITINILIIFCRQLGQRKENKRKSLEIPEVILQSLITFAYFGYNLVFTTPNEVKSSPLIVKLKGEFIHIKNTKI